MGARAPDHSPDHGLHTPTTAGQRDTAPARLRACPVLRVEFLAYVQAAAQPDILARLRGRTTWSPGSICNRGSPIFVSHLMTANRKPRSALDERELRLWKVGWALGLAFAAAVLVAGGIFYSLVELLDFKEIDSTAKLDAKTLFDLVKLSFGVVAGAGALVALVVAYRRQRVDEASAQRDATRLHTERFSQAVDKLGSDSPAVRLGGVHAVAGLADDAPDDSLRQTCIDVLCAYLRLPFSRDPGGLPDHTSTEEQREAHQDKKDRYRALREVRHTILRLIGDHYRIPRGTHRSWQGCNLDLTGVTIDGDMDFHGVVFSARPAACGSTQLLPVDLGWASISTTSCTPPPSFAQEKLGVTA